MRLNELTQTILNMMQTASKDPTRYHLNGVLMRVSEDNITLYATDGHIMAKVTQPLSILKTRSQKLEPQDYFISSEDTQKLKALDLDYKFEPSKVNYPNCENFIPNISDITPQCALDLNLLARLAKTLNQKKSAGCKVYIKDPHSPVTLIHKDSETTLIIMPMRI